MRTFPLLAGSLAIAAFSPAGAADYTLVIRDHKFEPSRLEVTAGERHTLTVRNLDSSAEEFESHELNREKIVPGGGQIVVRIGPLEPGEYPFVGEFHEESAQGVIVAR